MDISAGNIIIIIGLIVAGGFFIWQFLLANNPPVEETDMQWNDDIEGTEERIEETEEYMRRMERLSKRTIKDEDDDKKK